MWGQLRSVLAVFGANFFGLPLGIPAAFALLHLIGLGLVAWALAAGVAAVRLQ